MTPTITLVDAKSTVARYQGTRRLPVWGVCEVVRMGFGAVVTGCGDGRECDGPKLRRDGGWAIAIGLGAMYSEATRKGALQGSLPSSRGA